MSPDTTGDRSADGVDPGVRMRQERPRLDRRRARPIPVTAVVLALVGAVAAGCGSAPAASVPPVVHACSLVSVREAGAVFAVAPGQPPTGTSALESTCTYTGTVQGVSLTTDVTWDPRRLTNFQHAASPLAVSLPGRTPTGATIPALHWVHLTVGGEPALWVSPVPSTGPGSPAGVSELLGSKDGYVVMTQSTGLDERQATRVLGIMLHRL